MVFKFTFETNPQRHIDVAKILGYNKDVDSKIPEEMLSSVLIRIIQATGMPNGLSSVGFGVSDIPKLVEGTLPQHRVTKLAPKEVNKKDLENLFKESLVLW